MGKEGSYAQIIAACAHLVAGVPALRAASPRPTRAVFPSRRRASMVELVGRAHRFYVSGTSRTALSYQRGAPTWNRLLVCLSHKGATHPQALSWTHSYGHIHTLRGAGKGAHKPAIPRSCPSCPRADSAVVRAE